MVRIPSRRSKECHRCAQLEIIDVHAQHGAGGDNCYQPSKCKDVRSKINAAATAKIKGKLDRAAALGKIEIDAPQPHYSFLKVWAEERSDAPIHAIGAEIWQGNSQIAEIAPQHCMGWKPLDCIGYATQLRDAIRTKYKVKAFEARLLLSPLACPIPEGCYLKR